jgi:hypothetical protein
MLDGGTRLASPQTTAMCASVVALMPVKWPGTADEKTYQLVELRNRLHGLKENKKKAKNKFESEEQAVKDDVAEPETDDPASELDAFADTPLDQTTAELEEKVHNLLETPACDLEQLVDAE